MYSGTFSVCPTPATNSAHGAARKSDLSEASQWDNVASSWGETLQRRQQERGQPLTQV